MTTIAAADKPRQLTLLELDRLYPITCVIDPKTREVRVSMDWQHRNLQPLVVKRDAPPVLVHKDAHPRFTRWLQLVEAAGCTKWILSVDGGFVPRLKRGAMVPATTAGLSRHARGLAVDINASRNQQGTRGAQTGQLGCVLELVHMANECGLVWGGDWHGASIDPMHFEVGVQR